MQETALEIVDALGRVVELVGVVVLIVGMAWAAALAGLVVLRDRRGVKPGSGPYWTFRASLARAILLGLEILIAADIILTVTVDTTVESALALVLIVFVRVALSFTLTVEVEGRWPWQPPRESPAISPGDPT
jgi:uncharacterized membrane protein